MKYRCSNNQQCNLKLLKIYYLFQHMLYPEDKVFEKLCLLGNSTQLHTLSSILVTM